MAANRGNLVYRTTGFGEPAALRLAPAVRGAMRQTCFIAPSAKSPTEARRAESCASLCDQKCQVLCWSLRQDFGQRQMNRDVQRGAGGAGSLPRAHSNGSRHVAVPRSRCRHGATPYRAPGPSPSAPATRSGASPRIGRYLPRSSCETPRYLAAIRAIERGRLTAATPAKNPRHRARAARPLSNGRSP